MFKNILVTVDLDDKATSDKVMQAAKSVGAESGSKLNVVTIVPNFGMSIVGSFFSKDHEEKMLAQAQKNLHAYTATHLDDPTKIQHVIGRGNVYEEVLIWTEKLSADLIIVGAHRPNAADYLLGPNSARVVRHANCTVMVVRD